MRSRAAFCLLSLTLSLTLAPRTTAQEPFPLEVIIDGEIEDAVRDRVDGKIWLPLDYSHAKSFEEVREEFPDYRLARMAELVSLALHLGVTPSRETGVEAFVPEYHEPVLRAQELLGTNLRWPSGLRYSRGRVLETSRTIGIEGCHRYFTLRRNDTAGMALTGGDGACTGQAASENAGWWLVKNTEPVEFRRGDALLSGSINISRGIYLLNYLFLGGPDPACPDSSDFDDSGKIDLSDAVRLFNMLFLDGEPLPSPGFDCGVDPTEDELPCESYELCG